jgi:hypothetical protein
MCGGSRKPRSVEEWQGVNCQADYLLASDECAKVDRKEVSFTIPNEDEEEMADETKKDPTPKTAANKAAAPATPEKRTITLTFEAADLELHDRITKQADYEDRTPSIELLRAVRKMFPKPSTDNA